MEKRKCFHRGLGLNWFSVLFYLWCWGKFLPRNKTYWKSAEKRRKFSSTHCLTTFETCLGLINFYQTIVILCWSRFACYEKKLYSYCNFGRRMTFNKSWPCMVQVNTPGLWTFLPRLSQIIKIPFFQLNVT